MQKVTTGAWTPMMGADRRELLWFGVALAEGACAALFLTGLLVEPLGASSVRPVFWLALAAALALVYWGMAVWSTRALLSGASPASGRRLALLSASSVPFLAGFSALALLLQLKPGLADTTWQLLSPIQPFPPLAVALGLLAVFLVKMGAITLSLPRESRAGARGPAALDGAIVVAMLLLGVLQAVVYIVPIGNAFLRFWAIADAIPAGVGYPLTLTEPGPVSAGSPPYVYDLPLFPLMLEAAFRLLGHNSAAAHLPAAIWSALFPLSLHLLIRQATGSRVTGLVFSTLASLFPYLRFWVLNLPDPDPFLLTSLCLAAYAYLRALADPGPLRRWALAGVAAGVAGLARPEGVLYAGFLAVGILASRPGVRRAALFLASLAVFLAPMAAIWMVSFGFLWPQNYNRTLRLDYPLENLDLLRNLDALGFYHRGLGLSGEWALALLALFLASVVLGTVAMVFGDRPLLALAVPGLGNTVAIFFANPHIPNTFHFADFFRHASFGIPFLVVASAYGCHRLYRYLAGRRLGGPASLGLLLLLLVIAREGDILANPTATHRPAGSVPTQVLTTYTYLSLETILQRPMPLPAMSYYWDGYAWVAGSTGLRWPEDALDYFKPLDMAFDSHARPFEYGAVLAFLLALGFALLAEGRPRGRPEGSQTAR